MFGVAALVDKYLMWIGLIALAAYSLLLTHLGLGLSRKLARTHNTRVFLKTGRKALENLTQEEKRILSQYILRQSKTQNLDIQSGVVNGLEQANIIYRSANLGSALGGFAYNIQPWAWEELNNHPDTLEPIISG